MVEGSFQWLGVPECHKHVLSLPGLCGIPAAKVGRGGAEPGKGGCKDAVLQERCSSGLSLLRICSTDLKTSSCIGLPKTAETGLPLVCIESCRHSSSRILYASTAAWAHTNCVWKHAKRSQALLLSLLPRSSACGTQLLQLHTGAELGAIHATLRIAGCGALDP